MQLNTRNFFLYLLCVGFLVVAITTTAISNQGNQSGSVIKAIDNEETISPNSYSAEVVISDNVLDKEARLQAMREKVNVAGPSKTIISEVAEPAVSEETIVETSKPAQTTGVKKCPWYEADTRAWNPGQVTFTVVEGARLLSPLEPVAVTQATDTAPAIAILQLPVRTYPSPVATCLPSDVVAVALDGSLIRNTEQGLYSIFSAETLLGYSLDGFPLYGKNDKAELDSCGGINENGQYRYYLQTKRDTVLNCFSANPVKI